MNTVVTGSATERDTAIVTDDTWGKEKAELEALSDEYSLLTSPAGEPCNVRPRIVGQEH